MPEQVSAIVDAGTCGEPLPPFIYGQAITPTDPGLLTSLWAEMLQDRKFSSLPGTADSPWHPTGGAKLSTDRQSGFAGREVPNLQLTDVRAGIVQDRLHLVGGREYQGRIVLAGQGLATAEVALVWGTGGDARETGHVSVGKQHFATAFFSFTPAASTDTGRLEITARGPGVLRIAAVSLMPADNVHGLRADTLALLHNLQASFYQWRGGAARADGGVDRDARPAGLAEGKDVHDFGLDEFLALCREMRTPPSIVVEAAGGLANALEEVAYIAGKEACRAGAHREAIRWIVAGEKAASAEVSEALREAFPGIRLFAVEDWQASGDRPGSGTLRAALDTAEAVNQYVRDSASADTHAARTWNLAQCVFATPTACCLSPVALTSMVYRRHFGTLPVAVTGRCRPLDVAAAWTTDGDAITVAAVNPSKKEIALSLSFPGQSLAGKGRLWIITGPDEPARNVPGEPPQVQVVEEGLAAVAMPLMCPRLSVCVFELSVREPADGSGFGDRRIRRLIANG